MPITIKKMYLAETEQIESGMKIFQGNDYQLAGV